MILSLATSPTARRPSPPSGLGVAQVPDASIAARAVIRSSPTCTVSGSLSRPESTTRSRPRRATPVTRLGLRARRAAGAGHVRAVTGFRTAAVERAAEGLVLTSFDGQCAGPVDEVVALTGFRPDLSWLSEIRLDLDPVLQAPVRLAPLIDPNVHSCGTVYPHGESELRQPEHGVYLVGMKSYGRAPTFLALTGYRAGSLGRRGDRR